MKKYITLWIAGWFFGALLWAGCVDATFDEPPLDGENPDITVNATISQVLGKWVAGEIHEIQDDWVISGVVVSSDEAGNFYRQLVIEDSTGGIRLALNATGLFNDYPLFRRVFVKVKGLYIGDYHDLPLLGAGIGENSNGNKIVERIPAALIGDYVLKGKKNEPSPIREKTVAEITTADVNRLVRVKDVEFVASDTSKTLAETNQDANRDLTDCLGNTIPVRTSRYSDFADAAVPAKHGTVDAVVSIYNGGLQLTLNRYEDIKMTEDRCTGGGGGSGCSGTWTVLGTSSTMASLNEDFQSGGNNQDINLPGWLNATCVDGGRVWRFKTYQGNVYARASAYQDTNTQMDAWLITPGITDIGSKTLTFRSAAAYHVHDGLEVLISTDFDGTNLDAATWTPLSPTLPDGSQPNYTWIDSGPVSLAAFSGTGYIAFHYTGSGPGGQTSTFTIDDVKVQ